MTNNDKPGRQAALRALLNSRELRSQEEAREALADAGYETTQATVSRDLDELGAVKVRGADGTLAYRLATAPPPASAREQLAPTLRQFVRGVDHSGNLAVLRTPPACAQPVASAIDLAELEDVIATVAGDDTVLVVAAEGVTGAALADQLSDVADLVP
ncbi:MAG: arginine repressor [Nitriliruptorales bacterium]|nr:arginine repressor [Nitriliruptorales bacterium]